MKDRFDFIAPVGTSGFVYNPNDPNAAKAEDDGSGCQEWLPTLAQRPNNQPFFLWLAAIDPHRPYDAPDQPTHKASDVRIPPYLPDNEIVRQDFVQYYEEIHRMDDYIGQLMAKLEEEKLSENTLILFLSDNGRPFPREKTTLYEGGIRTPWIVKWPAQVKAGTQTHALVSSIDLAPTFLSLAGVSVDSHFEGKNFSEILAHPERDFRNYVYAEDHWHDFEDYARAVRTTRFKYIRNFYPDLPNTPPADALRSPTFQEMLRLKQSKQLSEAQQGCFVQPRPEEELFDVKNDPNEMNNLASDRDFQDTLNQMRRFLQEIRTQTQDEVPAFRTADEFDRESGKPLPNRIRPRPSKAEMSPNGSR